MPLRGDFWLYPDGSCSGELGGSEHAETAMRVMLKLPEDTTIHKNRLYGGISAAEAKAALKRGAQKKAVDFLLKRGDPRKFAIMEFGWIRVARNIFGVWQWDDETLSAIRDNKCYWRSQQAEEYDMLTIDVISEERGALFEVSVGKLRRRGVRADALRQTQAGVSQWRNPMGGMIGEEFHVESNGTTVTFRPLRSNPVTHAHYPPSKGAQILVGLSVKGIPRYSADAIREYVITYRRRQLGLALGGGRLKDDDGHGGSVTPSLGFWEKISRTGHGKEDSVSISILDISGEGMTFSGDKPKGMFYDHISDMVDHMAVDFNQRSIITQYHEGGVVRAVQDTINDDIR